MGPILGVSRHRLRTDGEGITTLVAFYGCPLHCRYCINSQCHTPKDAKEMLSPMQLYEKVKIDDLYFLVTGGGITFGGGEPLLYSDFIAKFRNICGSAWKIYIETSLNVKREHVSSLVGIVDGWIIDIKDWNEEIYSHYTGMGNKQMKENLRYLISKGLTEKLVVRVPNIPNFNTEADVEKTMAELKELGVMHIDKFAYVEDILSIREQGIEKSNNRGKFKCEVLKSIRVHAAKCNNIKYLPHKSKHPVCSVGCCPACDNELSWLTKQYYSIKQK